MEKDFVAHGVAIGQYEFEPEKIKDQIKELCIDKGMNYVYFFVRDAKVTREQFLDWAKYMADNEVYFTYTFNYGRGAKKGKIAKPAGYDNETALAMKEVAGKYFLGHVLLELGSEFGCAAQGYWPNSNDVEHISDAYNALRETVDEYVQAGSLNGQVPVTVIEATGLLPYVSENTTYPTLEMLCGNPEIMVPLLRASAKASKAPFWATYVADEWYGGVRNLDPLKQHRLRMAYDYSYMNGTSVFTLESGDERLGSHDTCASQVGDDFGASDIPDLHGPFGYDHPVVKFHRDVIKEFADFLHTDARPVGGPKVKVAFVMGNLDGYSPWRSGSALWNCYTKKEFGYDTPEFVWRLFDEITTKRNWADVHNFGEVDLSGAPAYGTYDIVPATADYEVLSKYDYLIFTGWNTMTPEIYENLKKFVQGGGRLFMTAAHLNTSDRRDGEVKLINDGDVSDLFGCVLDPENSLCTCQGYKFQESIVPELMYPADFYFDPLFAEGYVNYAGVTLKGATPSGRLSMRFEEKDIDAMPTWLTENKLGEGYAVLMTSLDYPSTCGYTAYKTVVREMVTASHRQAPIKVYGGDKLRFTVYEGDKVYLLNTDFDCQIQAIIDYGTEKRKFTLEPRELRAVER